MLPGLPNALQTGRINNDNESKASQPNGRGVLDFISPSLLLRVFS
jgi:hypothetical protein